MTSLSSRKQKQTEQWDRTASLQRWGVSPEARSQPILGHLEAVQLHWTQFPHYTVKEKDHKCFFQVAGPLGESSSPHGPAGINHPSGCSLPAATSHPRTAPCPASVCLSSDWLQGDGGDSSLHMFTKCLLSARLPTRQWGLQQAASMTPALALQGL